MKFIDTIEIKNFKSIRHQKIEGCKRVNVFIGYPNVGKSNILEALSLFSIDESNIEFTSFIRVEDLTTLFYDGDISTHAEIRINVKHRYIAKFENDSIIFSQQFESDGTSFEKKDTGRIFLDNSADVIIKRSFGLLEKDKKNVIDYRGGGIGKENEPAPIRKYEFSKNISYSTKGHSFLSYPFGNNLFNIISSNANLKNDIEELFIPYNLELLYETRQKKFTILKRVPSGIFSIPYELLADTLQRVIFYKTAILSNKETVLLFEEPEAHMFPPYISKFTSDIVHDENKNQFFITTHSPFVLNDLMENLRSDELAVYIVNYKKETGETLVDRMSQEDVREAYQFGYDFFLNMEKFITEKQHE